MCNLKGGAIQKNDDKSKTTARLIQRRMLEKNISAGGLACLLQVYMLLNIKVKLQYYIVVDVVTSISETKRSGENNEDNKLDRVRTKRAYIGYTFYH